MSPEISTYILRYGYLAIFTFVFLQEIGIPNPVPNELILLFSGYLAFVGTLSFPLVFVTVVGADFIGTSILYFVFYFFGVELVKKAPRWFPVRKVDSFKDKITKKGKLGIYLGRLIPYARGYVSIAAGLIRIPPRVFLTMVILSAITWSGGYAIAGRLLGKQWNVLAAKLGAGTMAIVLLAIILFIALSGFFRKKRNKNT